MSAPGGNPFAAISPRVLRGTCPQNRLDNVLLTAARERDVRVEYATELVSVTQDASGVIAELDAPGRPAYRDRALPDRR